MINPLELADKDFKAVIINFFKDFQEKKTVIVNEQMEEFQEKNESYFSKKLKNEILELKSRISEMKKSPERTNTRLKMVKRSVSSEINREYTN